MKYIKIGLATIVAIMVILNSSSATDLYQSYTGNSPGAYHLLILVYALLGKIGTVSLLLLLFIAVLSKNRK